MKVQLNIQGLKDQIAKHKKEIERKLIITVQVYAYNLAMESMWATPYGNIEKYADFYKTRPTEALSKYKLSKAPGNARGGWQLTINNTPSNKYTGYADTDGSFMETRFDAAKEEYKLGDTVYVTNYVPYVANEGFYKPEWGSLEGGHSQQAPDGILKPVKVAMKAYEINLQRIFDSA